MSIITNRIKLEILKFNYWEIFKHSKDLDFVLPIDHPRRIELHKELNKIQEEMNSIDLKLKKLGNKKH